MTSLTGKVAACMSTVLLTSVTVGAEKPNIVLTLVDDMGWSDLGCYGSEINTPNIDSLARQGVRFTQFYNTAKCMTSRASLLTGLYPQQCGMMSPNKITNAVTLGEVLRPAGYRTLASGKHHGTETLFNRGFDHYYGLRDGCCNFWNPGGQREGEPAPGRKKRVRYWCDDETTYHPYTPKSRTFYTTDAFTDKALDWLDDKEQAEKPFFLYLAYTAPHYPLHAWPEDIAKYKGCYDEGYIAIRKARYEKMVKTGLVDPEKSPLPEWDGNDWDTLPEEERQKEIRRMEIYAAMLDRVDQNLGRVIDKLKAQGKFENTIFLFASDNGACAEDTGARQKSTRLEDFGSVASYETVGRSWATVQNTPLRKWKNYSHEGGIRTPLIVSWPGKIKNPGGFCHTSGHLIDMMPTFVELTGAQYPGPAAGGPVPPMQGVSLLPALDGQPLTRGNPIFWQWSGGGAIRKDDMKAVFWGRGNTRAWELHDMSKNLTETADLAEAMPGKLRELSSQWQDWHTSVSEKDVSD
ncbi:MAG: arylsulfatase [Lentisphaeria bacterium]|nr:arylsulfatase [Lentisphaeria bacterium]